MHCIEGGFHLGATGRVTAHVHELAARGVLYVTLAHLFWRRVATNTPALPFLPDAVYNTLFPQAKGVALSPARRGGGGGDVRVGLLVDISHMRDDAIDATFRLIERSTARAGADPTAYPVIVSHAGYRFGGQKYNVTRRRRARGGPRRRDRADLRPASDQ